MKKLSKLQTAIFALGGVMLVVGAVLYKFEPIVLAPAVFSAGALFYVIIQWMQTYDGDSTAIKRLRKIQVISGGCILLSAALMIANRWVYDIFTLFKIDIYNSWIILLFIGVILQLYTILRIDNELKIE